MARSALLGFGFWVDLTCVLALCSGDTPLLERIGRMLHIHGGHPPVVRAATVVPARRVAPAMSLVLRLPTAVFGLSQVGRRWPEPPSILLICFSSRYTLYFTLHLVFVMFGGGRNCDVEAFRGGILSLVPAWCKSERISLSCAGCLGVGLSIFLFPNRIFHSC